MSRVLVVESSGAQVVVDATDTVTAGLVRAAAMWRDVATDYSARCATLEEELKRLRAKERIE